MKLKPTYRAPFKRRHDGKTDYKRRLKLLMSKKPRLVVRRTLKYVRVQMVEFDNAGDRTIVATDSGELKKMGWKFACDNMPAAYLTGLLVGKKSLKTGVKEAVLDAGLYTSTKGSKVYAIVKGAVDAGLMVPCDEKMFPPEEKIRGVHIAGYVKTCKELPEEFDKIKEKILKA